MKLEPGIYRDMSFADYLAIDAVNNSSLKAMATSAKTYKHNLTHGREGSSAMLVGRMAHTGTLERKQLLKEYAIYPGKVRRGKQYDAFAAVNPGKTIVLESEWDKAAGIADAVMANDEARNLLVGTDTEVSIVWRHEASDTLCKARLDADCATSIVDLKSTRHATPRAFANDAAKLYYHVQAAFYADAYAAATGKRKPFRFIAAQSSPPHEVAVYRVSDRLLAAGRKLYEAWLNQLWLCREHNEWPGVATQPLELEDYFPAWALPKAEDENDPQWVMADEGEAAE